MNPNYPFVASRAAHRCEYCHAPELVFNFPFEVEHIISLYRGGADAEFNWALSCRSCNLRKGTRVQGKDPESKAKILNLKQKSACFTHGRINGTNTFKLRLRLERLWEQPRLIEQPLRVLSSTVGHRLWRDSYGFA